MHFWFLICWIVDADTYHSVKVGRHAADYLILPTLHIYHTSTWDEQAFLVFVSKFQNFNFAGLFIFCPSLARPNWHHYSTYYYVLRSSVIVRVLIVLQLHTHVTHSPLASSSLSFNTVNLCVTRLLSLMSPSDRNTAKFYFTTTIPPPPLPPWWYQ